MIENFATPHYQDHNAARLAHLASLGLAFYGRVLEVGSGPGDHTVFYVERGCDIVSIDSRQECLDAIKLRFPQVKVHRVDMNEADLSSLGAFDVVHCYGLLYHLGKPDAAIAAMALACGESGVLMLETCVSLGNALEIYPVVEGAHDFTQSSSGAGCRPTRTWVFAELKKNFKYVYQTRTQPNHIEFPLDWNAIPEGHGLIRAVFVASQEAIVSPKLSDEIVQLQTL